MRLYRIAKREYALDLSGKGAEIIGGRWSPVGYPVVYTSEHPALCGFEKLVHAEIDLSAPPLNYMLIVIEVPGSLASITPVKHMPYDPQTTGKAWLDEGATLLLQVPSVVVPYSWNYLINVNHSNMQQVSIIDRTTFVFDPRIGPGTGVSS
jgi:RES domain-containing protein